MPGQGLPVRRALPRASQGLRRYYKRLVVSESGMRPSARATGLTTSLKKLEVVE
ncbi:MAG: hypothetical protein H7A43_07645 [Verrucomicrobia bacterium]|nr:hypothetical protein [Verrucomicrobiota bacterium]